MLVVSESARQRLSSNASACIGISDDEIAVTPDTSILLLLALAASALS